MGYKNKQLKLNYIPLFYLSLFYISTKKINHIHYTYFLEIFKGLPNALFRITKKKNFPKYW